MFYTKKKQVGEIIAALSSLRAKGKDFFFLNFHSLEWYTEDHLNLKTGDMILCSLM